MMSRNEVIDMCAAITAYDNREVTQANLLAWSTAAELGYWNFEDALAAVHEHFSESTEYLMPAHINERVKIKKDERLRARNDYMDPVPDDAPPASPERVREILEDVGNLLGWDPKDRTALTVECPHCGARVGDRCTFHGKPLKKSPCHPSRLEAALAF